MFHHKTCIRVLGCEEIPLLEQNNLATRVFKVLWKCKAPSKVLAFTWQVLLDRIPTIANLMKRGINLSLEEQVCVLCNATVEDSDHLFISFNFTKIMWGKVNSWLGVQGVQPQIYLGSIFNIGPWCICPIECVNRI